MAKPRIVILGGGFAGLRLLYRLNHALAERVELILVDERDTSLAKPVLPEVAFTGTPVAHARFPLGPVLERHGGTFIQAAAERIEPRTGEVVLSDGRHLPYDYLAITVGAVKDYDATPGFRAHGYSLCDDREAPRLHDALERFTGGPVVIGSAKSSWGTRVVVPSLDAPCEGPVGEAMFMLDTELRRRGLRDASPITVFSPGRIFFEDVGPRVHAVVEPLMQRQGIAVQTSKEINRIAADHVAFTDGSQLASALTVLLPVYAGNPLVLGSGLGDEKGFVPTDQTMRHLDYANIFAAGDGTSLAMPKLGHIATQQADVAAVALVREITGQGEVPPLAPEIFCIMNRGGVDATLILSNALYGGATDLALNSPLAHLMKWGFDSYYLYTHGHLPPDSLQEALEVVLRNAARS